MRNVERSLKKKIENKISMSKNLKTREKIQRGFRKRLENSQQSEDLEERLTILVDDITVNFYKNICTKKICDTLNML